MRKLALLQDINLLLHAIVAVLKLVGHCQDVDLVSKVEYQDWIIEIMCDRCSSSLLEMMTHHSSSLKGSTRELGLLMVEEVFVMPPPTTLSISIIKDMFSIPL